jgi:hypothetical protein
MARLPTPGKDAGNWGNILNDFLSQAHAADGSLKPVSSIADGAITPTKTDGGFERTANKGIANGYAALGSDGKMPAGQLPALLDPAMLWFQSDEHASSEAAHINWFPKLAGYLEPPLPTWISIDGSGDLVISQAGIYTLTFSPSQTNTNVLYSSLACGGGGFSLGAYQASPDSKTATIYISDAALPNSVTSNGSSPLLIGITNTPLT